MENQPLYVWVAFKLITRVRQRSKPGRIL